jgi:hypothetical protein
MTAHELECFEHLKQARALELSLAEYARAYGQTGQHSFHQPFRIVLERERVRSVPAWQRATFGTRGPEVQILSLRPIKSCTARTHGKQNWSRCGVQPCLGPLIKHLRALPLARGLIWGTKLRVSQTFRRARFGERPLSYTAPSRWSTLDSPHSRSRSHYSTGPVSGRTR